MRAATNFSRSLLALEGLQMALPPTPPHGIFPSEGDVQSIEPCKPA